MATGAAHGGTRSDAVRAHQGEGYREAIDRQLNRTRRQVKLVELGASSVLLLAGVLGFLLVASLVDHWVVSLGYVGRTVLLAILLIGVAWYFWQKVLPLLVRSINPEYAAHAIEESTPSLKNSLLNFLLLRRSPLGVKEVVLEALEKRAAADIATVPVDAAVDRSKLIRMGYLLVGIMAILGLYKILSPKDPFQTAARVLAPWADIARPSRVEISDVQPGSTEVYIGESVKVSAAVAGAREGDAIEVVYSTVDGTLIDQRVPMTAVGGGRFEATLPAGGAAGTVSSTGGLQQNVVYRVEAGDAATSDYRLTVIDSPRIVVEKCDYAYPAYTRKAPQSTDRGDLKGLEGTRVSITARANQPIKTAWIEFDPDPGPGPAETMKLNVQGDRATGVLVLQLRSDRRTPWRSSYQLRFINERQQQSQQPVLHGIEVLRDLPPEVEIITPQAREVEVPENGSQAIEVRAIDPDFGLTKVDLMGRARNREVVIRSMLEPADGQPPQISRKFVFRPSDWKLRAGEELTYWAVAEDNRTAVPSVASVSGVAMPTPDPQPNVAQSERYVLRIVAPRAAGERGGANDPNSAGQEDQASDGDGGAGPNDSPMDSRPQDEANGGENQSASGKSDSQQGKNSKQDDKGGSQSQKNKQSGADNQQSSGSDSGGGDSQSQQGGGKGSSSEKGESGDENSGDASDGSEGGGSGKQNARSGGKNGSQSGDQSGDPSGAEEGGEPSEAGAQGGGKGSRQQGGREGGSDSQQRNEPGEAGDSAGQQGPRGGRGGAGKKPEHDGDVFDRLLEELQKDENASADLQKGQGGQGPQQNGQSSAGEAGAENQPGQGKQDGNQKGQRGGNQDQAQEGDAQSGGESGDADARDGQQSGKSGAQGGKSSQADMNRGPQPGGTSGSGEKNDGQPGEAQQPMGQDSAQGKGPNDQKASGEGGRPQGGARTDQGEPNADKQGEGELKEPGAGQNGDSGAGKNSQDKTGSGQGQETNRDRQKEMSDSSSTPENGETSAPSVSKRQSDSKGGTSGDRSGGGSKGAGQSGGQEGNDSAGSNSAADEGAGAANETGMGETGSKGGQGEKSDGQTGSAGNEKGDGSSSRPSESGNQPGGASGGAKGSGQQNQPTGEGDRDAQSGQGEAANDQSQNNQAASARGKTPAGGTGPVVGGGVDADRPPAGYTSTGEYTEADQANLEFARKATDLVLSKLKEQEHNPDPELLDRLGMTREQMQEFIRRWDRLKSEAERDPNAARELDDALRSLGLKDPKLRKRSGGSVSDDQRGLRDSGGRVPPPSRYRDQFDAFRKGAARAGNR